MAKKKKVAMVAPRPAQPSDPDRQLAEILQMFGNDRSYTVMKYDPSSVTWMVLFEGDHSVSYVKYDGEKPVILKKGQ